MVIVSADMDINGSNSHPDRSQPSRSSNSVKEDEKFTEKDACDNLYINHAEVAWHELRRAWVGDKSQKPQRRRRYGEPIMSWSTTYEELLSTTQPFHDPIPLAEMVDFLVDIWLDDGLYA